MKKIIFSIVTICSFYFASHAQCDKNIVLESSKTEYLDGNGNVVRTDIEDAVVTITRKEVVIKSSKDHTMYGDIKSSACNWKVPFKEGRWVLDLLFQDQGKQKQISIIIEGKDGKVIMTVRFAEDSSKVIRVSADKFEEAK